jgi:epoxyqueuosine reductase
MSGTRDPLALAAQLKASALEEGALLAGLADPREAVEHAEALRSWVREGLHGPMEWFPRHAELRLDPQVLLPGARSLLMVALAHEAPGDPAAVAIPSGSAPPGRVASYALGRDYHKVIRGVLRRTARRFEGGLPGLRWRVCVDSAPLLERHWAWRAGLGWIGKNGLVIHPRYGSWLLLGGLLLDVELPADEPHPERCGRCTLCLEACPTRAFLAPYRLDAARCISAQTIENRAADMPLPRPTPGGWLFGCDDCQSICPWNRKALPASHPELAADPGLWQRMASGDWPVDEAGWDDLTRGRALRRMSAAMLRRNLAALRFARGGASADSLSSAQEEPR